jgi:hypothetical protein
MANVECPKLLTGLPCALHGGPTTTRIAVPNGGGAYRGAEVLDTGPGDRTRAECRHCLATIGYDGTGTPDLITPSPH